MADRWLREVGRLVCSDRLGGDSTSEAGLVQQAEAHVAASLGPFVVLLGRHRADEPDDGSAVG